MRKILPATALNIFILFLSSVTHAQLLDTASGPRVWLRSDFGTQTSLKWLDKSDHHKDATSVNGQFPAVTGTMNYNPVMTFDGVDDYLKVPVTIEGLMNFTVITVYQTSDTTERGIWGTENAVTRPVKATTRKISGPDTLIDNYGKNENRAFGSTVIQTWTTATQPSSLSYIALGSTGKTQTDKPFKGKLAELLIYNRGISFLERSQVETYLGIKYGIGHTGHNYVSSDERVLWDADKNKAYSNNIAGIGRDDGYLLNQKQSGSAYDSGLMVVSAGAIANSNNENKANIDNGDFIIWGDNGLAFKEKAGVGEDSILSVTQRKWMLEVSGPTAKQVKTQVQFDIGRLAKTSLGYWLVIDRSGQGNFSVNNLEYIIADKVNNGIATYSVQWDNDGSGKDAFALAKAKNFFTIVRKLSSPTCDDANAGRVSVELIAGKTPFQYTLKGITNKVTRDWKGNEKKNEEKNLIAGDYTVTIVDGQQNQAVRNFTLFAPSLLTVDLGPDQKMIDDQVITLDAGKNIPDSVSVSYQWDGSFGFSSTNPKVTITEPGIYTASVIRTRDGCTFKDDIVISGDNRERLAVFPNPIKAGDPLKMSFSLPNPGAVQIQVINASGGLVRELNGDNGSEYEFLYTLPEAGIYIVVLKISNTTKTYKIIVN